MDVSHDDLGAVPLEEVSVHDAPQVTPTVASIDAQATDTTVVPEQERHVPVASWHVVQEKRERTTLAARSNGLAPVNIARRTTGLPADLRSGAEDLSGVPLDRVRVHHNSPDPARIGALAYAQGTDIHLGPAQERHLPHEAWHVVQQTQGRVTPTACLFGAMPVNADPGLEREAETMGARLATLHDSSDAVADTASSSPATCARDEVIQAFGNRKFHELVDEAQRSEASSSQKAPEPSVKPIGAYIVNTILSYNDIGNLKKFILANLKTLPETDRKRVAFVFGINAPKSDQGKLDDALEKLKTSMNRWHIPVAFVRSVFTSKKFPYGQMRNEVLHSRETKALTDHFVEQGLHPYISIQDFDTEPRMVGDEAPRNIFLEIEDLLAGGRASPDDVADLSRGDAPLVAPEEGQFLGPDGQVDDGWDTEDEAVEDPFLPLMIAGGYRPAAKDAFREALRERLTSERKRITALEQDLRDHQDEMQIDRPIGPETQTAKAGFPKKSRIREKAKPDPVTKKLITKIDKLRKRAAQVENRLSKNFGSELMDFEENVRSDMTMRDRYAKINPLLPYAPEPNLFLDAVAVQTPSPNRKVKLEFGPKGGEYSHLAAQLNNYAADELETYYTNSLENQLSIVDKRASVILSRKLQGADQEDRATILREQEHFKQTHRDNLRMQAAAQFNADAQNNRSPTRGRVFHSDFKRLAVRTDLSRLAYPVFGRTDAKSNPDPQTHLNMNNVINRFFPQGAAKRNTHIASMSEGDQPDLGWLAFYRDVYKREDDEGGFDPDLQAVGEPTNRKVPKVGKKESSKFFETHVHDLGGNTHNALTTAMSVPFGGKGFEGGAYGVDPEMRMLVANQIRLAAKQSEWEQVVAKRAALAAKASKAAADAAAAAFLLQGLALSNLDDDLSERIEADVARAAKLATQAQEQADIAAFAEDERISSRALGKAREAARQASTILSEWASSAGKDEQGGDPDQLGSREVSTPPLLRSERQPVRSRETLPVSSGRQNKRSLSDVEPDGKPPQSDGNRVEERDRKKQKTGAEGQRPASNPRGSSSSVGSNKRPSSQSRTSDVPHRGSEGDKEEGIRKKYNVTGDVPKSVTSSSSAMRRSDDVSSSTPASNRGATHGGPPRTNLGGPPNQTGTSFVPKIPISATGTSGPRGGERSSGSTSMRDAPSQSSTPALPQSRKPGRAEQQQGAPQGLGFLEQILHDSVLNELARWGISEAFDVGFADGTEHNCSIISIFKAARLPITRSEAQTIRDRLNQEGLDLGNKTDIDLEAAGVLERIMQILNERSQESRTLHVVQPRDNGYWVEQRGAQGDQDIYVVLTGAHFSPAFRKNQRS